MTTTKAVVTQVSIGNLIIEGLMLPDGSFAIAAVQANEILRFSAHPNHVSRSLKSLLGDSSPPTRIATELNSNKAIILTLNEFETLVVKLAFKGNEAAQSLMTDLIGLSLTQLWSDAFGIQFEVADRKKWLEQRQSHRETFHPLLTRWLQLDDPDRKDYAFQVNKFKICAGVEEEPIEGYGSVSLKKLNTAYIVYNTLRKAGFTHDSAIQSV